MIKNRESVSSGMLCSCPAAHFHLGTVVECSPSMKNAKCVKEQCCHVAELSLTVQEHLNEGQSGVEREEAESHRHQRVLWH